jgi:hypothetical protein
MALLGFLKQLVLQRSELLFVEMQISPVAPTLKPRIPIKCGPFEF